MTVFEYSSLERDAASIFGPGHAAAAISNIFCPERVAAVENSSLEHAAAQVFTKTFSTFDTIGG